MIGREMRMEEIKKELSDAKDEKLIKKPKRTVPLLLVYEIPIILDTQHTREEDDETREADADSTPRLRTEGLAVCDGLQADAVPIARIHEHGITPPRLDRRRANRTVLRVLQAEEDQDDRDRDARVERGAQHVVVLCPPREVAAADHVLEHEAHDRPRHVVHRVRGRDVTRAGENNGEVDVFEHGVRPFEGDEVRHGGADRADEEEEHEPIVDLAFREL